MVTNVTLLKPLLCLYLLILLLGKICLADTYVLCALRSCLMIKVHGGQVSDGARHLSFSVCLSSREALPSDTLVGH